MFKGAAATSQYLVKAEGRVIVPVKVLQIFLGITLIFFATYAERRIPVVEKDRGEKLLKNRSSQVKVVVSKETEKGL